MYVNIRFRVTSYLEVESSCQMRVTNRTFNNNKIVIVDEC